MNKNELINDLVEKLSQYKDIQKLEEYINFTEKFFNATNNALNLEVFPMKYIEEQKKNLNAIKASELKTPCDYCEKALNEKKNLLQKVDSPLEMVPEYNYYVEQCKQTCEHFTKDKYLHYLSDEGIECLDSMIEIFGVEKVLDFCVLNAYKFFWRCDKKDTIWDVDKGISYLKLHDKIEEEYKKGK